MPFPAAAAARPEARHAPGRLALSNTIAIVDIGSNSVRLVVYEMLGRAPSQVFNEKEMAGLGRQVATTGRLADDAIEKAIEALLRFRILCEAMHVGEIRVIATAAARYAENGPAFIARAQEAIGQPIELISGGREAELSGLGVISGFHEADGVVGDLGGGSLELISVSGETVGPGASVPLGGLALQDRSKGSLKAAEKIVKDELDKLPQLAAMKGRDFYAVGGTWRALATLHQRRSNYPLNVMNGYAIPPRDAADFVRLVERADATTLEAIDAVSSARRPLLAYGALVLDELIKRGKPRSIVISAQGVREGLLYEQLPPEQRAGDPLLQAARDYNLLRARDPRHASELVDWTLGILRTAGATEALVPHRMIETVCLLSDIGWRAHPDYRGEQSMNVVAHAYFTGIDHTGRAFLAMTLFHRYAGLKDSSPAAEALKTLLEPALLQEAQLIAGIFRVAYLLSAGMAGILPKIAAACEADRLVLRFPAELAALSSERVEGRLKQLARLLGRDFAIERG